MVPDSVRLGFTAEISLPNQGFSARFLVSEDCWAPAGAGEPAQSSAAAASAAMTSAPAGRRRITRAVAARNMETQIEKDIFPNLFLRGNAW